MSQLHFSTSLQANARSSTFSLPGGGFYFLRMRRDASEEGGDINTAVTVSVQQLDPDGSTQHTRATLGPGHVRGVAECNFQVDPNGGVLSIVAAGDAAVAWVGVMDADQGSEFF